MCDWRNVGFCKATANSNRSSSPFSQWLQPGSLDLLLGLLFVGGGGGADLGNIHCLGGALSFLPSTTDSALKPRREAEGSASPHKWEEGARWLAGWEESREKEGVLWEGSGKPKIWAHSEHQVLEVLSAVLCSQFRRTLPEFPGRLSVPLGADCHLDQTPGELSSEACLAVLN